MSLKNCHLFFSVSLFATFAHADYQNVTCTGNARSGNTYRVTMELEGKNASYSSPSGLRVFDSQDVIIEEFNAQGERTFHHVEPIKGLIAVPPTSDNPDTYSFSGGQGDRISISGFGSQSQILNLNVGRFQGVTLRNSRCTIDGNFAYSDSLESTRVLIQEAQEEVARSQMENGHAEEVIRPRFESSRQHEETGGSLQ